MESAHSLFYDIINAVVVLPFSIPALISLIVCLFLVLASAFMSASEMAFFSLKPNDLEELNEDNKHDKLIIELRSKPEKLLATILIGNNSVNVSIIILATYAFSLMFNFLNPVVGFIFQTIIITFILLLFCEILPKVYATHHCKKIAHYGASTIKLTQKIFSPLANLMVNSTSYINKKLVKLNHANISVDELSHALKLTYDISDEDSDILEGIVNFGNINVNQIMTSRTQMVDIEIENTFKQVLSQIIESGYSRMPVYSENQDDIRGILYIKDLLPHLGKNDTFRWQTLIRPAYFVPETKMIDDLLSDFQKNKIHIAIVVDEFGGTSGLITLEDILEEIVGEISDEYDEDNEFFTIIDENTYLFEAKILLNDFFRIEKIDEELFSKMAEDADTLAGLILQIKGEIPIEKEKIKFGNYTFEIIEADDRHIKKVKLHIKENK